MQSRKKLPNVTKLFIKKLTRVAILRVGFEGGGVEGVHGPLVVPVLSLLLLAAISVAQGPAIKANEIKFKIDCTSGKDDQKRSFKGKGKNGYYKRKKFKLVV